MQWILLALISVFSISVAALFQKLAMRKADSDPVSASVLFQFLLFSMTFLFAQYKGFRLPPADLFPYFLVSATLYAIGTISFFTAIKRIEASEVAVLTGAGVIVTIIASFFILGDQLTPVQILGVLLILSAVIMINYTGRLIRLSTGAWYALLGTGAYGLAVVFDSFIIRRYDAVSFLPLACLGPGVIMLLWYHRRLPAFIAAARNINRNLVVYTLLYAIQAIAFYVALESGALVSQLSSIMRASIILTVLLSTVFLHETKHMFRKLTAAAITTIGIYLVT